jgi:cyclophilin family peptidyl-prolyl cis-trans isomerase
MDGRRIRGARRRICLFGGVLLLAALAQAQTVPPARVTILLAEDLRAPSPRDLATLQAGARSLDGQTAKLALRALGRLERPSVISAIAPALENSFPENRAEAANALAQAAQGWKTAKTISGPVTPTSLLSTLITALEAEDEPSVRAAICESIGRLPYRAAGDVARAEAALLEISSETHTITDRLGVVKGLEALVRLHRTLSPPSPRAIATLRMFAGMLELPPADAALSGRAASAAPLIGDLPARRTVDPLRDARVRRLALEALLAAEAIDDALLAHAGADPDVQVRRLAVRGATIGGTGRRHIATALRDPAAMVRLEALRSLRPGLHADEETCTLLMAALYDPDPHVALLALDGLSGCGSRLDAMTRLEDTVNDLSAAGSPRGWHRAAHAVVALAAAAPQRAAPVLGQFTASRIWQLRMYAARAAATLGDRGVLEKLAGDPDDNVVEAAIDGLVKVTGHASDAVYVAALSRPGYQAVRAAALALDGAPDPAVAVAALQSALARLTAEGRENSEDTRAAIAGTLMKLGAAAPASPTAANALREAPADRALSAAELRRLAAPRARVTIRGVGTVDLALFTSEAPATVLRFAQLAESRYYDGLSFHRVVPNYVVQGGSPGANEYIGDSRHMRDEVGLWPHVRGAVGISTRGRDTGDAQIFIDLVDNPRFDHEYTVFAQVLNGLDVVDRILEGDTIERIEIIP